MSSRDLASGQSTSKPVIVTMRSRVRMGSEIRDESINMNPSTDQRSLRTENAIFGMAGLTPASFYPTRRCNRKVMIPLLLVTVIALPAILVNSFGVVDFDQQALLKSYDGKVSSTVLDNNRHFIGMGGELVRFPRTFINVDFGGDHGVPQTARTLVSSRRLFQNVNGKPTRSANANGHADADIASVNEFSMQQTPTQRLPDKSSDGPTLHDFPSLRATHTAAPPIIDMSQLSATAENLDESESTEPHHRLGASRGRKLEGKVTTPEQSILLSATGATGKNTLSVRVKDGQTVSLALSLQIQLPQNSLKDLYLQYGDYQRYRSFLIPALSSRIREVCQRHPSGDFFNARATIVSELKTQLTRELEARHAKLVGMQMHDITWPAMLDAFIVKTESTKYTMVREKAARHLEQQRATAAASVLRLSGEIEMLQAQLATAGELEVQKFNALRVEETTVTDMEVRRVATKAQTDVNVYGNTTANLVAKQDMRKAQVLAETALEVLRQKKAKEHRLMQYNQEGKNLLLPEEARLLGVEAGSLQLLANTSATQDMALSAYDERTKALEAHALSFAVQLKEQGLLESAGVQRKTDLTVAKFRATAKALHTSAVAAEVRGDWAVVQAKLEGEAKVRNQVLARLGGKQEGISISFGVNKNVNFGGGNNNGADASIVQEIDGQRGLGMSGHDMVHLSWLEAYGALQKSGAVRGMELRTPGQLRIM